MTICSWMTRSPMHPSKIVHSHAKLQSGQQMHDPADCVDQCSVELNFEG